MGDIRWGEKEHARMNPLAMQGHQRPRNERVCPNFSSNYDDFYTNAEGAEYITEQKPSVVRKWSRG